MGGGGVEGYDSMKPVKLVKTKLTKWQIVVSGINMKQHCQNAESHSLSPAKYKKGLGF